VGYHLLYRSPPLYYWKSSSTYFRNFHVQDRHHLPDECGSHSGLATGFDTAEGCGQVGVPKVSSPSFDYFVEFLLYDDHLAYHDTLRHGDFWKRTGPYYWRWRNTLPSSSVQRGFSLSRSFLEDLDLLPWIA
jgi:hypothetical protein